MRRTILTMAACTLALGACGSPEFQYPRDDAEGVYFKLPADWTVFDRTDSYFDGRIDGGATAQPVRVWVIDSAADPDPSNADRPDTDTPVGIAQIIALSPGVAEQVSISAVRSIGFEFDPVSPATGLEGIWEVALDQPLRTEDGISGAVAVFSRRDDVESDWLTHGREVFLDPTRERVYILDVYCTAECFETHRDDIFDVLDSWRIDL